MGLRQLVVDLSWAWQRSSSGAAGVVLKQSKKTAASLLHRDITCPLDDWDRRRWRGCRIPGSCRLLYGWIAVAANGTSKRPRLNRRTSYDYFADCSGSRWDCLFEIPQGCIGTVGPWI